MADGRLSYLYTGHNTARATGLIGDLQSERLQLQPVVRLEQGLACAVIFFDEFDDNVFRVVRECRERSNTRILAVLLGCGPLSMVHALRLLDSGASDVIVWKTREQAVAAIASRVERWRTVEEVIESPMIRENFIGRSAAWLRALRDAVETALFTDAPILLNGESGTGKELVARLVHSLSSARRDCELVVVDCTTIVPELSGSEFFGHERGAYTGAAGPRIGAFELADGGSLFLDEVGELLPGLQAQLLRVVQERTYKRVGGNTWRSADFRLICATNRDLQKEVREGRFRADLYYRIAACTCELPPLRDRSADILALGRHFLRALRPDDPNADFDEPVQQFLQARSYPGNVRDLKQLVARMAFRHAGPGPVSMGAVPEDDRASGQTDELSAEDALEASVRRALSRGADLKEIARMATDTAVRLVVGQENGNLQRAAKRLGVTDRALQMRRAAARETGINQQILASPTDHGWGPVA